MQKKLFYMAFTLILICMVCITPCNKILADYAVNRLYSDTESIPIHETQLVNYLTATNTDHGLLINFGGERIEIKRKFREYKHI